MNLCNNNNNNNNYNNHKSVALAIVELLPDRRQWKVYILLVSHRAFSTFHMPLPLPLPHALGLVLAFYSIESWHLQTFATGLSPPPEMELTSTAAVHVNYQAQCIDQTTNTYDSLYLSPTRLHWMRFQNCKLNLPNFSKLQQQEANRQHLAKVLPKVCNQL